MTIKLRKKSLFFLHESDLDIFPFRNLNTQLPEGDVPAAPAPDDGVPDQDTVREEETGSVSVGVYTASRALPVPDAVVTVFHVDENNDEHVLAHYVTDRNGRIPDIVLPVIYNPTDPMESTEFYFTTYNLRVQAFNYYTQNVLDIRVFPHTTTRFNIDLIPVAAGVPSSEAPEQTIVIPPSPVDFSNVGGE